MGFLQQVFQVPSFATGASVTSAVEMPGSYLYCYLVVPTMSAGYSAASTPLYLKGSADGVTFYRFSNTEVNTTTVGTNDFTIQSLVSQRVVNIPNFALRYVQVEISGTCTAPASAVGFKFITITNQ